MVRGRLRARPTIERKIYFYRVDAGLDEAGRPLPFNSTRVLQHIDSLPWTRQGRYWVDNEGKVTCCWVDALGLPHRVRIGNIRRTELPQVEETGVLSPLDIPPRSGIAEQIHVVFFNNNIVGADFNYYGPRISRLSYYLHEKARGICPPLVNFKPLLRQNVLEELDRLGRIRLFNLRISASYAATVALADRDLGSAFEAAARVGEAEELEIILKPAQHSRSWLSERLHPIIRRLAGRQDLQLEASRFKVRGQNRTTGQIEEIDLLNDKLIAKRRILQIDERTRALDRDSAYAAIEDAFDELRDNLIAAAGVEL